jgi:hypothetical protein
MADLQPDKRCHAGDGCKHCGMDMDAEPYCVQVDVLARRTAVTGRTYPFGLDTNPARALCEGKFFEARALLATNPSNSADAGEGS